MYTTLNDYMKSNNTSKNRFFLTREKLKLNKPVSIFYQDLGLVVTERPWVRILLYQKLAHCKKRDMELMSKTIFRVVKLRYAEIKHSDWLFQDP